MKLALPSLEEINAELARRSLAHFVCQAWEIIEPSTPLIWNWHLDVMCEHIQALLEGRLGKNNLAINVPPGSMKSTVVSVCAPAWVWAQREDHPTGGPTWRGLFLSGSESIALRDSMKCRDILESRWYRETFRPMWAFSRDQNAKGFYRNTAQGFRKCQPAGSKITGERAHAIFVDDPNDASQDSKADRTAINYWWDNGAANRVADPATGKRCLIQQRLNEEDLTGHILSKEREDWDVLVIREEHELPTKENPAQPPTALGWVDPRTKEGELFFPARFPAQVVAQEKRRLGAAGYAGQHQQRPAPATGLIFQRAWWKDYKPTSTEPQQLVKDLGITKVIQFWDTAFKDGEQNDYSVCTTLGVTPSRYLVLEVWRRKVQYPELKAAMKDQAAKWKPTAIPVEDKASAQSALQELKRETRLPLLPQDVDRDKVARANAITPLCEAGLVYLPEGAPWRSDWVDELAMFPNGAHDDQVDSFDGALEYAARGGEAMGLFDYYEQLAAEAKRQQEGAA